MLRVLLKVFFLSFPVFLFAGSSEQTDVKVSFDTLIWILSIVFGLGLFTVGVLTYYGRLRREYEKGLILNGIDIPVVLLKPNCEVVSANKIFLRKYGKKVGEDKSICSLFGSCPLKCKDRFDENCIVGLVEKKKRSISRDIERNGRIHRMTASPIFDNKGVMINAVESIVDIDDIVRTAERENMLNSFLADLIRQDDYHNIVRGLLKKFVAYFGADNCFVSKYHDDCDESEMQYCVDSESAPQKMYPYEHVRFKMAPLVYWFKKLESQKSCVIPPSHFDLEGRRVKTGKTVYVNFAFKKIYVYGIFSEGKVVGWCAIAFSNKNIKLKENDRQIISTVSKMLEIVRAKRENFIRLQEALKDARKAERAKSYFLASMSHEIRTPLNSVIGFSNLIKDSSLSPDTLAEYAENISFAGRALLETINDVLDLSKLESGKFLISRENADIKSLCLKMAVILRDRLDGTPVKAVVDIGEIPVLKIDAQRIRQILFNLIGNAAKFTKSGSIRFSAKFVARESKSGDLHFEVSDTGCGISDSDKVKIFEPFIQAGGMRGTYAERQGTGLGLPICKKILDCMDGEISLESVPDKGSTFSVKINGVEVGDAPAPDDAPPPTDKWRDKKVILVDDVKMNLSVVSAMLKKLGALTVSFDKPREALERFKIEDIDAVITDIWMPDINGAELAKQMRIARPNVKIFALSADVVADKNFDMSAIDTVLTKPLTLKQLSEIEL